MIKIFHIYYLILNCILSYNFNYNWNKKYWIQIIIQILKLLDQTNFI